MTETALPLSTGYQATLQSMREDFGGLLEDREDINDFIALITPEYYRESLEAFTGNTQDEFKRFLFSQVSEKVVYLALSALPKIIGYDSTFNIMSFHLDVAWADRVEIK